MRRSWIAVGLVGLMALGVGTAEAKPVRPKKPTRPVAAAAKPATPPAAKADASTVGRAALAKELPRHVTPGDRRDLDAAKAKLHADDFDGAVAVYKRWCDASVKPMSREDVVTTALWVFREGALSKNEELAAAADRARFFDERTQALDDSLALLRGAVITKKPVFTGKLVVLGPYVREARGDERRDQQVPRDGYNTEIRNLERAADEAATERTNARSAYEAVAPKHGRALQALAALVRAAEAARLPNQR